MLPYNKIWLLDEMKAIQSQMKKDKRMKKDNEIMRKYLLLLLIFFVSAASAADIYEFCCPNCLHGLEMHVGNDNSDSCEVKPGTWTCPNPRCRYINDNRIRYCPLCGSERQ